jgi:multiple sugar transport system substrate-binding protein
MRKSYGRAIAAALLCSLFAVGCSSGKETPSATGEAGAASATSVVNEKKDPITLTIYNGQPGALDLDKTGVMDALKKKFPYITFTIIPRGKDHDYPDLIAGGTLPDIIYESASFTVSRIMEYGFQYDLQDMVKKHNLNLQQFEQSVLQQTQYANTEGKLYGLPFTMNRYALFYNKDVFDKFAVPYPKDGMTWDEIYDLARKTTRQDQTNPYIGFETTPNNMMLNNQLSLGPFDTKENKAAVNTDGWKTLFENLKRFYEIPGNTLQPATEVAKGNIAMALESHPTMIGWARTNPNLNWDVVSLPSLKEKPNIGLKPASLALFIAQNSKYKDDAFEVISYLVSEEVQTLLAKQGVGTPLASAAVKKVFGQDVSELKGKNTGAFYYYKDAPPSPLRDPKLTNVSVDYGVKFVEMINNQLDVNTTLRSFEEEINKSIETAKGSK